MSIVPSICVFLGLAKPKNRMRIRQRKFHASVLVLVRTRVHRSEVMFRVLVVILCCDRIAILSFSAGQRQISLIGYFHVLKALRLRSGRSRSPTIGPIGSRCSRSKLACSRGRSVVVSHFWLWEDSGLSARCRVLLWELLTSSEIRSDDSNLEAPEAASFSCGRLAQICRAHRGQFAHDRWH